MVLYWLSLLAALLGTAFAQFFYKVYFVKREKKYLFLTLLIFVNVPLFSYYALRAIDLNIVYMSTAVTQVIIVLLSKFGLNETIQFQKVCAIGIIILGMAVYLFF
ncbi:hypothetical protein EDC39_104144 [Geothermobacter ehrlichii]|uniref:EamA-like transporter family protein n=1 Tax=Geothermobacter ehrlichii TaxID=213224 RepID=A0A5D3WN50_9BACT|nr:hypothetical protein [Geothermobacter ehrlichii]TYO99020.1 hypothetical protein EDC39_104144 [Geothermobacter ehrlichii]